MSLIHVTQLHASYGHAKVLRGVDIDVAAGEIVALLGRNGAGKTTTLKALLGWVLPTSGEIRIDGRSTKGLSTHEICRAGVGLIPEDRRIFPTLTVEENLRMGFFQAPAMPRAKRERKLEEIYDWFPKLKQRQGQAGKTLSGGEQQMLAIARGLVGEPRALLIDEPTEGLAPLVVKEIFASITRMKQTGLAVLLVEQNVHGALSVADRCVVIEKGETIAGGTPQEILSSDEIKSKLAV